MAPRFLIDENLSPRLALHLRDAQGFDAVHVQDVGLRGASDAEVFTRAISESRIVMTGNASDFRRLGASSPGHPGLAIIADAVGRARQVALGVALALAIEAEASRPVWRTGRRMSSVH